MVLITILQPKQLQFILGMKDGSPSLWPEGFWAIPLPEQWPGMWWGKSFLTCSSKIPQSSSKVFISGDSAGHWRGSTSLSRSSNHSVTSLAVCIGALSCRYTAPPSGYVWTIRCTYSSRMVLKYLAVMSPSSAVGNALILQPKPSLIHPLCFTLASQHSLGILYRRVGRMWKRL